MSISKTISKKLTILSKSMTKSDSKSLVSSLPYYKDMKKLGELYLIYEGSPTIGMIKSGFLCLYPLLTIGKGITPKGMSPMELMDSLPTMTLEECLSEVIWLTKGLK